MSRVLFCAWLCLALLAGPAASQETVLKLESVAVAFNRQQPQTRQVGRLIWRGGIAMSAGVAEFGGWSDLHVSPDGRTLTAVSDHAAWFTATIRYDGQGNLAGVGEGRLGMLKQLDGKPIAGRGLMDSEGLARLPDGSWLVSFERQHRLWRYPVLADKPVAVEAPVEFARQPANGGAKAVIATAEGQVVLISEELSQLPGTVLGWIGTPRAGRPEGRYDWRTFNYVVTTGFQPTSLALLPDGAFVVLEHGFDAVNGIRSRLTEIARAELQAGTTVAAAEIAVLAPPFAVDNFEGVAVTRGARGETLVWLLADDGFNPLQRNLLLLFELAPSR